MFAYCLNNPVNLIDKTGQDAATLAAEWGATMWWLYWVDGLLPVGDIIYWGGWGLLTIGAIIFVDYAATTYSNTSYSKPTSSSKQNAETQTKFVSDFGSTTAPPPGPGNNRDNKYRGGSTYNRNGIRIDFEYYGNGKGNVHIHINGQKFHYDIDSQSFRLPNNDYAPRYVQDLLKNIEILRSIDKAIRYIS